MSTTKSKTILIVSRILAAVAVYLFAGFRYGEPTWLLPWDINQVALMFAVSLLFVVVLRARLGAGRGFLREQLLNIAAAAAIGVLVFVISETLQLQVSRLMLLIETAVLGVILGLNYGWLTTPKVIVANVLVFLAAVSTSLTPSSLSSFKELILGKTSVSFSESSDYILSSRYDLKITRHSIRQMNSNLLGGGLAQIDSDRQLVATGDGEFYVLSMDQDDLGVEKIEITSPMNRSDYVAQVTSPSPHFRVTDMYLSDSLANHLRLYVSHHYWDSENQCMTLNLSEIEIESSTMRPTSGDWISRFASEPCLTHPQNLLSNENGGRISFLPPSSLLVTVGTHSFDSIGSTNGEYDRSSYGKIIEINTDDWTHSPYSIGHRNAQGLLVTDNSIFVTEHGPHGGDELNIVSQGQDYGWPRSTYGTAYGQKNWPGANSSDEHYYGEKPVFSWVPSIGVSNLIQIEGTMFASWNDDLLVASLIGLGNGRSLFRVKLWEDRVVLIEKIAVGEPVRDLLQDDDGRIVLWNGADQIAIVEPTNHVFATCSGCHAMRWTSHGIGPDLMGVVGDKVARHEDFPYSSALSELGGRWTTDRLDRYLQNPSEFVPGTSMQFAGIDDPKQRAEIIEYLAKLAEQ